MGATTRAGGDDGGSSSSMISCTGGGGAGGPLTGGPPGYFRFRPFSKCFFKLGVDETTGDIGVFAVVLTIGCTD